MNRLKCMKSKLMITSAKVNKKKQECSEMRNRYIENITIWAKKCNLSRFQKDPWSIKWTHHQMVIERIQTCHKMPSCMGAPFESLTKGEFQIYTLISRTVGVNKAGA